MCSKSFENVALVQCDRLPEHLRGDGTSCCGRHTVRFTFGNQGAEHGQTLSSGKQWQKTGAELHQRFCPMTSTKHNVFVRWMFTAKHAAAQSIRSRPEPLSPATTPLNAHTADVPGHDDI